MYNNAVDGITNHLMKRCPGGLLYCAIDNTGHFSDDMGHLSCFIGGMLALGVLHNVNPATAVRDLENAKSLA